VNGTPIPLPKQGRGGDIRNAPHPPVRAVEHIANQTPVVRDTEARDGGAAA
jgi:hypothetical protein